MEDWGDFIVVLSTVRTYLNYLRLISFILQILQVFLLVLSFDILIFSQEYYHVTYSDSVALNDIEAWFRSFQPKSKLLVRVIWMIKVYRVTLYLGFNWVKEYFLHMRDYCRSNWYSYLFKVIVFWISKNSLPRMWACLFNLSFEVMSF